MSEKYIMTDERLRGAIVNMHAHIGRKHRGSPLWSLVGNIFGHGSGVSAQICRQVGLDPYQLCGKAYLEPAKETES